MTTEHDEGFKADCILPQLPPTNRFPGEYHENYSADEMRAWALAQHAAGIEAAAKLLHKLADAASPTVRDIARSLYRDAARDIEALKPAPRSAEHTAEPSAQERERFEAWLKSLDPDTFDYTDGDLWLAWQAALATAPNPRIEAEPVVRFTIVAGRELIMNGYKLNAGVYDVHRVARPERTQDARSTSDTAVVLPEVSSFPAWLRFDRMSRKEHFNRWLDEERTSAVLADRDAQSTDSSAEAAMAKIVEAAQSVVDRWDAPLWNEKPRTEEVIHRLRDALADAAKLTTAPHTADETRVDGGA